MLAILRALPALINALIAFLGIGYVAWKLETTGAGSQVARGVGGVAEGAGGIAEGVGGVSRGLGGVPSEVLVFGGLALAFVLLRR